MLKKDFLRNRSIYLMAVPVVAFFLVFYYIPMFGLVISFKRFTPALGIFGSPWVGFKVLRGLLPVLLCGPHHPQHDSAQRSEPDLGIPGADHPGAADQRGALDPVQALRAEPHLPAALHLPGGGMRPAAGVLAEQRPVQRPARLVRRRTDLLLSGSALLSQLLHRQRHVAGDWLGQHHLPGGAGGGRPATLRGRHHRRRGPFFASCGTSPCRRSRRPLSSC